LPLSHITSVVLLSDNQDARPQFSPRVTSSRGWLATAVKQSGHSAPSSPDQPATSVKHPDIGRRCLDSHSPLEPEHSQSVAPHFRSFPAIPLHPDSRLRP
jgi:hypothetical protein